jgi:hypothetical protein
MCIKAKAAVILRGERHNIIKNPDVIEHQATDSGCLEDDHQLF